MKDLKEYDFDTLAVRAGWWDGCPLTGAVTPPISQTTTFAFKQVEDVAKVLSGDITSGFIYTRGANPTEIILEERMAALEGGEAALAFNSGVSSIIALITFLVQSGDHIVASRTLYAATQYFFRNILAKKFGVAVTFVDATDPSNIACRNQREDEGDLC